MKNILPRLRFDFNVSKELFSSYSFLRDNDPLVTYSPAFKASDFVIRIVAGRDKSHGAVFVVVIDILSEYFVTKKLKKAASKNLFLITDSRFLSNGAESRPSILRSHFAHWE